MSFVGPAAGNAEDEDEPKNESSGRSGQCGRASSALWPPSAKLLLEKYGNLFQKISAS